MLLRRLYSSLPPTSRAGGSHSTTLSLPNQTTIKPQVRRNKPRTANTSALCKLKPSTAVENNLNGNGRLRRRIRPSPSLNVVSDSNRRISIFDPSPSDLIEDYSNPSTAPTSTSPSSPRLLFTHPVPSKDNVEGFKPIYLYPEQFKLHYTFTPSYHPLPLNMGTSIYTNPRKQSYLTPSSVEDIFERPPAPNPAKSLGRVPKKVNSGLNDHIRVVSHLSHPELIHGLGGMVDPWSHAHVQSDVGLEAILSTKISEMKKSSDAQWDRVLSKLEGKQNKVEVQEAGKDANLDEVVGGLNDVLAKMGLTNLPSRGRKSSMGVEEVGLSGEGEEGVLLDSVKRKRKKKISKHKYKKRRKATRALRKRLGK
ncbi:hypothetical protein I302_105450 [Kwoniella bestiolae CBS 10118]|uniref:Small ribosomal subunit protein mS38 n=1 Tax=Kwoniella bestiolae CBS 10118 TaxID=1296100 RepID=A0A1B9FT60_9TREE|nr:hypothetical protein I302_08732 [Kwoniella bestiolae CBS 10118]OCF21952.1 hypothetical protein I302_08732 [Kwoniella bestiolae CBS 10118]